MYFLQVYESCFGPEVVKEVRKEMKMATAKCSGLMPSNSPTVMLTNKVGMQPPQTIHFHNAQITHSSSPVKVQSAPLKHTSTMVNLASSDSSKPAAPTFDLNKLQQAILEGYNKHVSVIFF